MSARPPEPLGPVEYARQVRVALRDVAPGLLAELLEDLDEHLTEAAADTDEPLQARLGPPATYAQELRRAAGLPTAADDDAVPSGPLTVLRETAGRLGRREAVQSVLAFLPELRPAWWVLRGWMAVVALGYLSGYHSLLVPFGVLLGPPLIAVAMAASVRVGRRAVRRADQDPRQRLLTVTANAGLALVALVALVAVQQQPSPVYASDPGAGGPTYGGYVGSGGTLARPDGSPITNIYPYSPSGQPLTGVLLYDQDGRALENLAAATREGVPVERVLPTGPPPPANAYPQQQRPAGSDPASGPTFAPQPPPTELPSPDVPAPAGTPTPGAPTPSGVPSPTPPSPGPSSAVPGPGPAEPSR